MTSAVASTLLSALPAIVFLTWKLGGLLIRAPKIVREKKQAKLVRKMLDHLDLHLKRSYGGNWYVALNKKDGVGTHAALTPGSAGWGGAFSESIYDLREGLKTGEQLTFITLTKTKKGEMVPELRSLTIVDNVFKGMTDEQVMLYLDLNQGIKGQKYHHTLSLCK